MRLNFTDFTFVSFVDRLYIFAFLFDKRKCEKKFNKNLGVWGVITYFYGSSKQISIFLDV